MKDIPYIQPAYTISIKEHIFTNFQLRSALFLGSSKNTLPGIQNMVALSLHSRSFSHKLRTLRDKREACSSNRFLFAQEHQEKVQVEGCQEKLTAYFSGHGKTRKVSRNCKIHGSSIHKKTERRSRQETKANI